MSMRPIVESKNTTIKYIIYYFNVSEYLNNYKLNIKSKKKSNYRLLIYPHNTSLTSSYNNTILDAVCKIGMIEIQFIFSEKSNFFYLYLLARPYQY